MRRLLSFAGSIAAGLAVAASAAAAPLCFPATGKATDDAQTIRLQADSLGWTVGVPASFTAGSFIKGKVALYPKGNVTICLNAEGDSLGMRVKASTGDDNDAAWRKLPAKRKGV